MGTRADPWLPSLLLLALGISLPGAAVAQESAAPDTKVAAAGHNGVSSPQCLYCPQPNFSRQITDLTVKKTPGYGLEDQALQTVATWKMKPCAKDDRPVNCRVTVEVSFKFNP